MLADVLVGSPIFEVGLHTLIYQLSKSLLPLLILHAHFAILRSDVCAGRQLFRVMRRLKFDAIHYYIMI